MIFFITILNQIKRLKIKLKGLKMKIKLMTYVENSNLRILSIHITLQNSVTSCTK